MRESTNVTQLFSGFKIEPDEQELQKAINDWIAQTNERLLFPKTVVFDASKHRSSRLWNLESVSNS